LAAALPLVRRRLFAIEQDRPDVARKRERWRRHPPDGLAC
jgi:hypothetical protein